MSLINRESTAYRKWMRVLEALFLTLAGTYLIYRVSRSTTFHLVLPAWFEPGLRYGLIATALARFLALGVCRWQSLAAVALALVYGAVYRVSGFAFLLYLAILTVGFIDIDYRRIFRMYLLTVGVFYAITITAGYLGVITNFVFPRVGRGIRSAWGMSYYTDFASLGLFIVMALWVTCRKLSAWAMLLICAGFLMMSAFIAHSYTSTICGLLLFGAMLYGELERRFIDQRPGLRWIRKGPERFAMIAFPVLALVMFALMWIYTRETGFSFRLDKMLSSRLSNSVNVWKEVGIRLFGTPFEQHGAGFSTFPSNVYSFVDSTYPLILLRYGWVMFLAVCLSWGWTAKKVIRCGDRRLLLVMGIIAIHSFSEHHFLDSHFNILVTMPLAAYPLLNAGEEVAAAKAPADRRAGSLAWAATVVLFAAVAWLAGPALLCRLKTVLELLRYGHGEHALRLIVVLGAVLFGIGLAAWAVSALLKALLTRAGLRGCRRALIALLLCAVAGAGLWACSGRIIGGAAGEDTAVIEANCKALEVAARAATGKVVSGVLPTVYEREVEGVSSAAFFENDLARLHGATVLLPSDTEHNQFLDNGFLYVPVSERNALYTSDQAVVTALSEAGYHPTGFYSSVQTVDLMAAAEMNGFEYAPETGLRMDGSIKTALEGPWQDLYGGKYTATWELSLPEAANGDRGRICTLRVTTFKGDNTVAEQEVQADEFDSNGRLSVSMPFKIRDCRNVAFEASVAPGAKVDIASISFLHTPSYDVRAFYDGKLRKIREENYSLEGEPVLNKNRWFACDYGYDRYKNIISRRYYGCDGELTLNKSGYAELRSAYNAKGQVIRNEYYGTDGQPILNAKGRAAVEYEYDDTGKLAVKRYYDETNTLIREKKVE